MEKGLMEKKVRIDLGHLIHPTEMDLVHSRRLALLTLHFVLCMRNVAFSTHLSSRYLLVELLLNYKITLSFTRYPLPLSLYYIFLYISLENSIPFQKIRKIQNPLFYSLKKT